MLTPLQAMQPLHPGFNDEYTLVLLCIIRWKVIEVTENGLITGQKINRGCPFLGYKQTL